MFELNGSYSDVQKRKTKTANRSPLWLPKIGTLVETIEERCRGDSDPSQHIPLLHRPRGPSLPSKNSSLALVVAARIEDTSSLVNKTVKMPTPPLIRLAMVVVAPWCPACRLSRFQSHSDASYWLHHDICALSIFVLRVHPSIGIKMSNPHSFVGFSSLGAGEDSCELHSKMIKHFDFHSSIMFLSDVLP